MTTVPYDAASEEATLGSVIIDPDVLSVVIDFLPHPGMFYSPKNQKIYAAMLDMFSRNETIELIALADKTKDMPALMKMANTTISSANVRSYARVVREKAMARAMQKACAKGMSIAVDESQEIDVRMAAVEAEIHGVTDALFSGANHFLRDLVKKQMQGYGVSSASVVKTGFSALDRELTGLCPGEFVVVAGRTSMGKTTFALDVARHVARSGKSVQIFSLEMTAERIADRLLCAEGFLPGQDYRHGRIGHEAVGSVAAIVHDLPITIYDSRVSTHEIRAKCMRIKNLGLVVIDFITLLRDKRVGNISTSDHVGEIAKRLQAISKELRVPFLVVSQMNRGVEIREDKTPRLSDLRESGSIEEAADTILFIHREEYYDRSKPRTNTAQVIIAKQRDGPTGCVELAYYDSVPTFRNQGWLQNGERGLTGEQVSQ